MGMNCKKAAYYMAKKDEKKLTSKESFLLRFHLFHCGMCRKFNTQLNRITTAVKSWSPVETLNPAEKEMLKTTISKNL